MVKHKTRLGDLFLVPAVLCCMDTTNVSQSPSDSLDLARELADPAKVFEITGVATIKREGLSTYLSQRSAVPGWNEVSNVAVDPPLRKKMIHQIARFLPEIALLHHSLAPTMENDTLAHHHLE